MGKSISRLAKRFFPNRRSKILMVGLDASGKTTILYKLKLGEIVSTMPTIGFNVETVEYRNISFSIWDVGGQSKVQVATPQAVCRQKLVNVLLPNPDITNFWMQKEAIRPLWRHYFENTQGLIFVVDSNDRERIPEARNELHRILDDKELSNAALLVFANKQDFPDAMPASEIADKLGLYSLGQRCWYIQSTSAASGEGLCEGLDWLSNSISRKEGSKNAK